MTLFASRLRRQASRLILPASESPSEVRGLSPVSATAATLAPPPPPKPRATKNYLNGNGSNGHHSNGKSPLSSSPNFITSTPNTSPAS